jgi:ATP phosphoribosyltransferase regulatory subunit
MSGATELRVHMRNWLLPEYIEDVLPAEAGRIERLRRSVLDLFRVHGYQLVMPPLLEYVESLLTGSGRDLDLKTFKLVDQVSGRMLGLRADITPQVARIDAHLLNRRGVTRLCYSGSVVHTLPSAFTRTREPLQVGAELYGHSGLESDVEIQRLVSSALDLAGVSAVHVDIGHVGVFRALVRRGGVSAEIESELFKVLQAKDAPALRELVRPLDRTTQDALAALLDLYGEDEVLTAARKRLPRYPEIIQAIAQLRKLSALLRELPGKRVFDLAELRGYRYHSGVVFAAYVKGWATAVVWGGRYDEVGKAFGRARPATGFSMDLRELVQVLPPAPGAGAILAPYRNDAALRRRVKSLRTRGEIVIDELPGHANARAELGCERALVKLNGKWVVRAIDSRRG